MSAPAGAPLRAERSAFGTPRDRAHDRDLRSMREDERIRDLPSRSRRVHEAEDPATAAELLLRDLPYARVMALALVDLDVRAAVALLPADWRWSA